MRNAKPENHLKSKTQQSGFVLHVAWLGLPFQWLRHGFDFPHGKQQVQCSALD